MISVVIPLYNKENFISKAIQSVLDQTFRDFELLIVDDGSTDTSIEKITAFDDVRIRIIPIKNSGVSVARNIGIENAKFDLIAFLDADDWWDKDFLNEIVGATRGFPEKRIFASGRSRVFEHQVERYKNEFLPEDGDTLVINYYKVISKYLPLINSSNVVIKKALFYENGFFRAGQMNHEDHDLWMRLCINDDVVFVNKNLSFYRKDQTKSASKGTYSAANFCTYLDTIKNVKERLTDQESVFFKKYFNRYIVITFVKYYGDYSKNEENEVYQKAKKIVTGRFLLILKILKTLPYKGTYAIFKYFK